MACPDRLAYPAKAGPIGWPCEQAGFEGHAPSDSLYVDTSVLVSALTHETATDRAQHFLPSADPEELATSAWVVAEFSSAMSVKLRMGQIVLEHRNTVLAGFRRLMAETFEVLPVDAGGFTTAARFSDQYALGLRTGDALHLAIAAEHGATLVSLDKRLVEAGASLGAATLLL